MASKLMNYCQIQIEFSDFIDFYNFDFMSTFFQIQLYEYKITRMDIILAVQIMNLMINLFEFSFTQ